MANSDTFWTTLQYVVYGLLTFVFLGLIVVVVWMVRDDRRAVRDFKAMYPNGKIVVNVRKQMRYGGDYVGLSLTGSALIKPEDWQKKFAETLQEVQGNAVDGQV